MSSTRAAIVAERIATSPRPLIMGIVNVTPDSFSDGGLYAGHDAAVARALRLADDGADIVDIGGESTRPPGATYGEGAARVDADEEIRRVIPVVAQLHELRPELLVSVDTMKPSVAERAVAAGASIINDVSAGRFDERMWSVAAYSEVAYVLMHGHDPHALRPLTDADGDGEALVDDVHTFLMQRVAGARARGVATIIADVGIGFAKGPEANARLLREHGRFTDLGVPLLVGASRKAFIGRLLGGVPAPERDIGTLAAHAVATLGGASIIRTHDVRASQQFLTVFCSLIRRADTG